jgi:hypothetical protein
MNETWVMKISHTSVLWADGTYLRLSRKINQLADVDDVTQRGKVVTVTGGPSILLHLASQAARDLESGYVTKVHLEPKGA